MKVSAVVFACHDDACAPPPVGKGGSCGKGGCRGVVSKKVARGVLGKGTQSFKTVQGHCDAKAEASGLCKRHEAASKQMDKDLAFKRANYDLIAAKHKFGTVHPTITAAEARGDSKPVSANEFQRLATIGQIKLDKLKANTSPIKGLDDNWDAVKSSAHAEALKEWGGATIDAHTGKALPQGINKYAMTIKDKGVETVSIPQGASEAEFNAAMDTARERFRPILEREGSHLGVFHDDDLGRIDFDPVLVVDNLEDVHTIGAATRAIGGAYNFADGNGYWPPHVREGE